MTAELFTGEVSVAVLSDPEEPIDEFVVLTVCGDGPVEDVVKKRREWHRRLKQIPPGSSGPFRLSIS